MVGLNDGPASPDPQYSALPANDAGSPLLRSSPTSSTLAQPPRPESPAYLTPLGLEDGPNRASYLSPNPSIYGMGDRRDSSYAGSLNSEAPGNRGSWASNMALNPNGSQTPRSRSALGLNQDTPPDRNRSPLGTRSDPNSPSSAAFPLIPGQSPPIGSSPDSRDRERLASAASSSSSGRARAQMGILPAGSPDLGWKRDGDGSDEQDAKAAGLGLGLGPAFGEGEELNESEKPAWWPGAGAGLPDPRKRRRWWWIGGILAAVILLAVALGAGLGVHFSRKNTNAGNRAAQAVTTTNAAGETITETPTATSTSGAAATPTATTGVTGSFVILTNGTNMTYTNPHGGNWAYDSANPYILEARPNDWSPPLSEPWDWNQQINGVNLGGLFVLEPFIVPGLFEQYANGTGGTAIDEYTLSLNMGADLEAVMTNHYDTFITEVDIMEIAAAGLTWIRLPIGYWAIETWEDNDEPYLAQKAWPYILRVLGWCRKYGLRVNFDLHGVPGSQNGWNHSGRLGQLNWMNGVMGLANLQRSMNYMRTITEFISQPEWKNVIGIWGILNEPLGSGVGWENLRSFYIHQHDAIRNITGYGEGNGPIISIHEGFLGYTNWTNFAHATTTGADRMMLDIHQYTVFQDQNTDPLDKIAALPCNWWAASVNDTMNNHLYNTGEWSAAINDCGHWVNGVGQGQRYDGTFSGYANKAIDHCDYWNNADLWNASTKEAFGNVWKGAEDALQNNFFWTWKIGASTVYDYSVNVMWDYSQLLKRGIISNDPRQAVGYCQASAGVLPSTLFTGYQPYMTGGVGAGTIPAAQSTAYPWPLTTMSPNFSEEDMTSLPQYTPTATAITLSQPVYTGVATSVTSFSGDGWYGPTDTQPAYTAIATCTYPDIYSAASIAIPASACGAGAFDGTALFGKRTPAAAGPTPAPDRMCLDLGGTVKRETNAGHV